MSSWSEIEAVAALSPQGAVVRGIHAAWVPSRFVDQVRQYRIDHPEFDPKIHELKFDMINGKPWIFGHRWKDPERTDHMEKLFNGSRCCCGDVECKEV